VYGVTVVGKANIDYLVRGPRLPKPGQSVNGDFFQEAPGGKGANQAVGAARLGARVALIARVGSASG
jgi:ribokinase